MSKQIWINSMSVPDRLGYNDKVMIKDSRTGTVLYDGICSACPNPYRPSDKTHWTDAYGWIACGTYSFSCIPDHHLYGKCLLINNGEEIPARLPNVNHEGRKVLSEVFVHHGDSGNWRGSAGCITIAPLKWGAFIDLFKAGEVGQIIIVSSNNTLAIQDGY